MFPSAHAGKRFGPEYGAFDFSIREQSACQSGRWNTISTSTKPRINYENSLLTDVLPSWFFLSTYGESVS